MGAAVLADHAERRLGSVATRAGGGSLLTRGCSGSLALRRLARGSGRAVRRLATGLELVDQVVDVAAAVGRLGTRIGIRRNAATGLRLGVDRLERVVERRSADDLHPLRRRDGAARERDRLGEAEVGTLEREDAGRVDRAVDGELEALALEQRDLHDGVRDEAARLHLDLALELLDGEAGGHHIADFLQPDVAGLIDDELLALLLSGRHELEHVDAHDVSRRKAVLELARHEILGRRRGDRRSRGSLALDHIESREDRHRGRRRLEIARAARIHPRIDFAADQCGHERRRDDGLAERSDKAALRGVAVGDGMRDLADFLIRMHDLDSGVAEGAHQAIHLEGLRARDVLIGLHGVGI